jgi:hypothetical protein
VKLLPSAATTRARSASRRLLLAAVVPAVAVLSVTGVALSQAGASPVSPPAAPAARAAVHQPVLGRAAGTFSRATGLGKIRPRRIDFGGDPTSFVKRITWHSWGGLRARGTGRAVWVPPGQPTSSGRVQNVTIVGFHRGMCHGTFMYRAVEWFFPQHHQHFTTHHYANVCAGHWVGAS